MNPGAPTDGLNRWLAMWLRQTSCGGELICACIIVGSVKIHKRCEPVGYAAANVVISAPAMECPTNVARRMPFASMNARMSVASVRRSYPVGGFSDGSLPRRVKPSA